MPHTPVVLAIENDGHRQRMVAVCEEIGVLPEQVGGASLIYRLTREQFATSLVLLDTDDDVACLVQSVNDYHRSPFHAGGTAFIICMVSEQAATANPRLSFWLIDGAAAVMCVWLREWDCRQWLRSIVHRRSDAADPVPERPTYDDLVTRVLQAPENGQGLIDLGVRLCEWQDSHRKRYEVARAFLRHAVWQMPDNADAHRHYGGSFPYDQWQEGLLHLREAVRLAPEQAEGYLALGQHLVDRDREEALKVLNKAIELDANGNTGKKARNVIAVCRLA